MDKFEMVEKLSQKAGVSYDEARDALEKCDWDILDAMLLLEEEGKARQQEESAQEYTTQKKKEYTWSTKGGRHVHVEVQATKFGAKLWAGIKEAFKKGNANQFVVNRKDEELIAMPITVLVLLLICFWPFSLIILFLGLFFKARYAFRGPDISNKVNSVMSAAQEKAANVVQVHRYTKEDEEE